MQVFADPTELTEASRLPEDVVEVAKPLPRLEDRTGADLLLSISAAPLPPNSDVLLRKHCEDGMLIQLKRHNDLQSAIVTEDRLFYEILNMREWCERAWLVVSGAMFSVNGKAVIGKVTDKKLLRNSMARANLVGRTGLQYVAVDGALDAWRYYGGYAKFMTDNDELLGWLKRQARTLQAIKDGVVRELEPRSTQRELARPGRVAWLAALFDGIGHKTAKKIWDTLDERYGRDGWAGGLLEAIAYVTDYDAVEIPGITEDKVREWREHLGLTDHAGTYATIGVQWRNRETGKVFLEYGREHDA